MRARRLAIGLMLALSCASVLSGCSVHKDFYATGGSRADGVVDVGYEYQSNEQPVADRTQAYQIARSKCALWGYGDAEPFGPAQQTCEARSGFGQCAAFRVSIKYQCLGAPAESNTPVNYLAPTGVPALVPRAANVPVAPASAVPPMSKQEYQQRQLQKLMEENLPYEEYQKRYRAIIEQ
jgi:hypothetical protein